MPVRVAMAERWLILHMTCTSHLRVLAHVTCNLYSFHTSINAANVIVLILYLAFP